MNLLSLKPKPRYHSYCLLLSLLLQILSVTSPTNFPSKIFPKSISFSVFTNDALAQDLIFCLYQHNAVIADFSACSLASLTSSSAQQPKCCSLKCVFGQPLPPKIILYLLAFYGSPEYKFPTRHTRTTHLSLISYLSLSPILFCMNTKLHSSLPIY